MFVIEHEKKILFDFPNLKVFVPTADYLLAMKVLAARADTEDVSDVEFLLRELQISELSQITEIVRKYYPNKIIKPETEFLLEELLQK